MQALFVALAMLAGLSNPIQSAANAAVGKALGHPVLAVLLVYAVASAGLVVCLAVAGFPLRVLVEKAADIPWWGYAGGVCNLVFALAAATVTQKIGSGAFTVTVLVTAVVLSILLDHFGLMGLPMRPASWLRMVGAAMAIGGVALVSLF